MQAAGPVQAPRISLEGRALPPTNNPTLRQRRLGAELRKLRERSGLTVTQGAALLGVNPASRTSGLP